MGATTIGSRSLYPGVHLPLGGLRYPVTGHDLPAVPNAALEIQVTDLREIAGQQVQSAFGIGKPFRRALPVVVLDAERVEEMLLRVIVRFFARCLLEDV